MDRLALHLFGVIHLDRESKVRAELEQYAGDLDAIFLERPVEDVGLRTLLRGLALAPGSTLGYLFYGVAFTPLYALVVRDPAPTEWLAVETVAEDRDLPVHHVDDHPATILAGGAGGPAEMGDDPAEGGSDRVEAGEEQPGRERHDPGSGDRRPGRWRYRALGWLAALVPAAFDPVATATTGLVLVGTWLATSGAYRIDRRVWLVAGVALPLAGLVGGSLLGLVWWPAVLPFVLGFLGTAAASLRYRNGVMIDRVRSIAAREGYDDACLVTGKAHLRGLFGVADGAGIDVERVHVSKLFRSGNTDEDPGATYRPPEPVPGTETEVLGRRIAAAAVDGAVVLVVGGLLAVATATTLATLGVENDLVWFVTSAAAGVLGGPILYYAGREASGGTIGKRLLGLTVVRTDGSEVDGRTALVRNLLRPLDLLTGYLVGLATILLTERNQKPSDLLAGTVVVATRAPEADGGGEGGTESSATVGVDDGEDPEAGSSATVAEGPANADR